MSLVRWLEGEAKNGKKRDCEKQVGVLACRAVPAVLQNLKFSWR